MEQTQAEHYLADIRETFRTYRNLAEKAMDQAGDDDFFFSPDPESNSIAVLAKHVGGNLRSRWTDFLTTDGEKPDRNRDGEFEVEAGSTREAVLAIWAEGWARLEDTLAALTPQNLARTVHIRGEPLSVMQAIHRSLAHTASHVGQIVYLAKHRRGGAWKTLSIPRGASAAYSTRPPR